MQPCHHRTHRHLEGRRNVAVRHLLDVEEDDGFPWPLVQSVEGTLEAPNLLPQRGLALGAWRQRTADWHRLDPGHHLPPPQPIETKAARDRDEPRQDGPLRVEPLEVDEGTHERVLSEVLGVGRPEQSPAEAIDGPVKALHQLLESRAVAATGAMRKLDLCPPTVCIRGRGRSMVSVDAARSSPSTNEVRTTPEIISWAG